MSTETLYHILSFLEDARAPIRKQIIQIVSVFYPCLLHLCRRHVLGKLLEFSDTSCSKLVSHIFVSVW